MRPQDLCWGPARGIGFSQPVALLMFAGYFIYERRPFTRSFPARKWLILLGLWITVSMFLNWNWPAYQTPKWMDLMKVLVIALFTAGLVDDKKRLDLIIWVIALSLGFYGIKGGLFGIFTGGRILQGPGGMLKDNNDFCLAMNMILPMLYYLGHCQTDLRLRRFFFAASGLTIVAIIITTSRGGFLTLCGVLTLFVLNSNKKAIMFSLAGVAVVLFIIFMPADVRERLATLKDPKADGSAAGRLHAWGVAYNMFEDRPWFGVGFHGFTFRFRQYDDTPEELWQEGKKERSVRVAHNSYLQLLAESGGPGLLFFLLMLASTIFTMRKIRRLCRQRDGPIWLIHYSHMIETSMLAFMAGAMFLNRSHFDLLYQQVAIGGSIYFVGMRSLRGEDIGDTTHPLPAPKLKPVKVDPWEVPAPTQYV